MLHNNKYDKNASFNFSNKLINPNFILYNIFVLEIQLSTQLEETLSYINILIYRYSEQPTSASNNSEYQVFHSVYRWKRTETVITIFSLLYTSNVSFFFHCEST